jgi:exodeoxyribonuclease VII large subunit
MAVESISLSTLNGMIREATREAFPDSIWLVAEIHEMHINRSGHCYLELIEKSAANDQIVAKSRATIWSYKYRMLRSYFESTTGSGFQQGIKVLVKVDVEFHELYGFSLNISDIDPSYTMGDLAMKRQEVIRRLKSAGIMDMNRELFLPEVPQRIAVISSETAAGYGDFMGSLMNNSYGFVFSVSLFPAVVQGEAAEGSIISALEKIFLMDHLYDLVVLIRGGGSQSDLDCFNSYDLAMNIAQFPLPVITGIGHERDETIADMVAHQSLKTPTAVAEFLIDKMLGFSEKLGRLQDRFTENIRWIIQKENTYLQQKGSDLNHLAQHRMVIEKHSVKEFQNRLKSSSRAIIREMINITNEYSSKIKYEWKGLYNHWTRDLRSLEERRRRSVAEGFSSGHETLRNLERSLELLKPEKVLARGYSITYAGGKVVKSVKKVKPGSLLETRLADGRVESTIEKIEPSEDHHKKKR